MIGGDRVWLVAIVEALRVRSPIWYAMAAAVGCAILLRFIPYRAWWGVWYGELRLDLWWPLIFVGACGSFYLAGQRRHRRTGAPQFFPLAACCFWILCLCLLIVMIILTASHWNFIWCIFGLATIAYASYGLALALVAYGELWRMCCHSAVAATVTKALKSGDLESILKEEARCKRWGSPHGLRLVHGRYQENKCVALSEASVSDIPVATLKEAVRAGDALVNYLDMPWAANVLSGPQRRWLQQDVVRELLTICLATRSKQWEQYLTRWMDILHQADDPYHEFLLHCFELGSARSPDIRRVCEAFPSARRLYTQAGCVSSPIEGLPTVDLLAIMQNTWLALAHHGIPAQATFDFWMDLRRQQGSQRFLQPKNSDAIEYDAAHGTARKFLADHYAEWATNTAPGWRTGLDAGREWNLME